MKLHDREAGSILPFRIPMSWSEWVANNKSNGTVRKPQGVSNAIAAKMEKRELAEAPIKRVWYSSEERMWSETNVSKSLHFKICFTPVLSWAKLRWLIWQSFLLSKVALVSYIPPLAYSPSSEIPEKHCAGKTATSAQISPYCFRIIYLHFPYMLTSPNCGNVKSFRQSSCLAHKMLTQEMMNRTYPILCTCVRVQASFRIMHLIPVRLLNKRTIKCYRYNFIKSPPITWNFFKLRVAQ